MSRARGFTLLELMVAIAILAGALLAVMQIVTQGLSTTQAAQDRVLAMELAEQKLAELMLQPEPEPGEEEGEFGELYPRFRWRSEISETELEGLYRLVVEVTWTNGEREQMVEIETCYAVDTLVEPGGATGGASPSSSSSSPSPS